MGGQEDRDTGSTQRSEERWGQLRVPIEEVKQKLESVEEPTPVRSGLKPLSNSKGNWQKEKRQKEDTFHTNKHDSLNTARCHLQGLQKTHDYIYPPNTEHLNLTRGELDLHCRRLRQLSFTESRALTLALCQVSGSNSFQQAL